MAEKLLTKQEAAKFLNITEQELENFVSSCRIPSYHIGGQFLRFKEIELRRFKNTRPPKSVNKEISSAKNTLFDKVSDFFYFYDFYIISILIIIIMLMFIFR